MLRYLINGVREEVSNRLGKLVRSDAFANAVGDYDQFRVPELDHNSFLSLPPVAPERMARYHAEAEAMIVPLEDSGAGGIYKHIVGAIISQLNRSLFYEALDENLIGQVTALWTGHYYTVLDYSLPNRRAAPALSGTRCGIAIAMTRLHYDYSFTWTTVV